MWIMPNITPDKETGIGNWTDAQIVTGCCATARGPMGRSSARRCRSRCIANLSDGDAAAIAAYLRSLTPVHHVIARTEHKSPPRAFGPPVTHVGEPDRNDKAAYGGYLRDLRALRAVPHAAGQGYAIGHEPRSCRRAANYRPRNGVVISRNITLRPRGRDRQLDRCPDQARHRRQYTPGWHAPRAQDAVRFVQEDDAGRSRRDCRFFAHHQAGHSTR